MWISAEHSKFKTPTLLALQLVMIQRKLILVLVFRKDIDDR